MAASPKPQPTATEFKSFADDRPHAVRLPEAGDESVESPALALQRELEAALNAQPRSRLAPQARIALMTGLSLALWVGVAAIGVRIF